MDFGTIRLKLDNDEYKEDGWLFVRDVRLVFDNAAVFNTKNTFVYSYAKKVFGFNAYAKNDE